MKTFTLVSVAIGLLLFSNAGYAQFGGLGNKVKNAVGNKVKNNNQTAETNNLTTDSKMPETKTEATTASTTVKTMSNGSININPKYFLYEDIKLIPGATFYFSDKPFGNSHEGAKTDFTSNGFIYGRLELKDQTIEAAFKLTPIGKNYYVIYSFGVVNGSEGSYAQTMHNSVMIKTEDLKKSAFNFDVLPDPKNATTGIGMNYDYGFDALHISGGPMYQIIDQKKFPDNGEYIVQLQFYFRPVDGWGNGLPNSSDWPGAQGAFKFNFNTADVALIQKNFTAVHQAVKTTAFQLHAMPDYWPKTSRSFSDASLSAAALESMIKAALNSSDEVLVKFAVANNSPGTNWIIQKNDLGVPTYALLGENIYTLYQSEGKCFIGDVSIAKDYIGGGKYGKPYVRNVNVATSGYGTGIDCSAVK